MLQKLCVTIIMTIMTSISPLPIGIMNLNSCAETTEQPIGVTYEVPEGITDVTSDAITNSNDIETLILPSTAVWKDIEWEWVEETYKDVSNYDFPNLKKIIVSEQNPLLSSNNGVLFDKTRETLLFYPSGKQEKSYIVPNGVTTIKEDAFQNKNLEEVILPHSLKTLEPCALQYTNIKQLQIPDNVILPDDSDRQSGLVLPNSVISVTISGGVKKIGEYTFTRRPNLTKIGLSEGLEKIENAAFYNSGIKLISIPKSVRNMSSHALMGCNSLDFVIYRGIKLKAYHMIWQAGAKETTSKKMPKVVKEVNLVIDDVTINFDGSAERPFYYKNKVYIPSQYVCNLCGISTKWISWYPCIMQYQKEDTIVKVTTGENMATINNEPFDIGAEAFLINEESPYTEGTEPPITMEDLEGNQSTLYCPIDIILEKFGMNSHYSKLKNTLYIETK